MQARTVDGEEIHRISNHQFLPHHSIAATSFASRFYIFSLFFPSGLYTFQRAFHLFFFDGTDDMSTHCALSSTVKCTLGTCPLSCAQVDYVPTLAGNSIYATAFGILLVAQVGLGIRYKTWGFMVGMVCGLLLEVVGYAGRIMLHDNPFDFNNFIM